MLHPSALRNVNDSHATPTTPSWLWPQNNRVKDTPDADASLTLLGEVRRLKAWLRQESPWQHDQRAKALLTRLDEVLVGCDKKEAKRLSQVRCGVWGGAGMREKRELGGGGQGDVVEDRTSMPVRVLRR